MKRGTQRAPLPHRHVEAEPRQQLACATQCRHRHLVKARGLRHRHSQARKDDAYEAAAEREEGNGSTGQQPATAGKDTCVAAARSVVRDVGGAPPLPLTWHGQRAKTQHISK